MDLFTIPNAVEGKKAVGKLAWGPAGAGLPDALLVKLDRLATAGSATAACFDLMEQLYSYVSRQKFVADDNAKAVADAEQAFNDAHAAWEAKDEEDRGPDPVYEAPAPIEDPGAPTEGALVYLLAIAVFVAGGDYDKISARADDIVRVVRHMMGSGNGPAVVPEAERDPQLTAVT